MPEGLRFVWIISASPISVIVEIKPAGLSFIRIPAENQPPLLVHADRMKAVQITLELLKVITWRNPQVLISRCVVDHLQPAKKSAL